MNRILHDANNAQRILKLTADTMLLVDRHGVCVDIEPHCDLWFLQEDILLGKNIFELLPEYTRERVMPIFQIVLEEQRSISKNFKLVLKGETFYFKCLMFPYDGMVLCQYRDNGRTIRNRIFFIILDIPVFCARKMCKTLPLRNMWN